MNKLYNNRGYTLLFASLTAALVLGVAVFILSVSRRQFILSSIARNSMYSIYAADSAIECVALRNAVISSTTVAGNTPLDCNGVSVSMSSPSSPSSPSHPDISGDTEQSEGYMWTGGTSDTSCAKIVITTGIHIIDSKPAKIYSAYGYNLCKDNSGTPDPTYDSPNIVERALKLTYRDVE